MGRDGVAVADQSALPPTQGRGRRVSRDLIVLTRDRLAGDTSRQAANWPGPVPGRAEQTGQPEWRIESGLCRGAGSPPPGYLDRSANGASCIVFHLARRQEAPTDHTDRTDLGRDDRLPRRGRTWQPRAERSAALVKGGNIPPSPERATQTGGSIVAPFQGWFGAGWIPRATATLAPLAWPCPGLSLLRPLRGESTAAVLTESDSQTSGGTVPGYHQWRASRERF